MPRFSRFRRAAILVLILAVAVLWSSASQAQHHPRGRVVVGVGVGVGYPYPAPYFYPYVSPWYWWGPYWWGPYPYFYPYFSYNVSSLRIDVEPNHAQVFVDGYLAGEVDRFDNAFQRLEVAPGGHEITIYLEGYRTYREQMYLEPGGDRTLQFRLEALPPGEISEPPPPPTPVSQEPAAQAEARTGHHEGQAYERPARQGTLSLRVDPGDAEIRIGSATWAAGAEGRASISLPEGRHTLEVRKPGYEPYVQDILIRPGGTLRLTVTLKPV